MLAASPRTHTRHFPLGWVLVTVAVTVPLLRWGEQVQLGTLLTEFNLPLATLRLGQAAGIAGFTLFAFPFLLSTRAAWTEHLFGGLPAVYRAHHQIGGTALLVLLVHPLALALQYAAASPRTAALLLVPQRTNLPVAWGIFALLTLILLLVLTLFVPLAYRAWLVTHRWMGVPFGLAGLHILLIPSTVASDPLLRAYLAGWFCLGLAAYAYRTLFSDQLNRRRYRYRIVEAATLSPAVIRLKLAPEESPLPFTAGQFAFFRIDHPGTPREWHPFTLSGSVIDPVLEVTVKGSGVFTSSLLRLGAQLQGSAVAIEGAYGRFTLNEVRYPRQVWIAGGIGITPFLSLASSVPGGGAVQVDLFYSARQRTDLVGLDELKAISAKRGKSHLRVYPWVSEQRGQLTVAHVAEQIENLTECAFLLCGPLAMVQSIRQQLRAAGVPRQQIFTEEFALR